MKKIIHSIRNKPKHVRQRILVICMVVITPLLLAGGIFSFFYGRNHSKQEGNSVWTGLFDAVSSSADFMIESDNI